MTTNAINGKALSKWLEEKTKKIDIEVIRKFAFQLIFVMAKCHIVYGLQHNDIHEDNIFVTEVTQKETLYFKIDGGKDNFQIDLNIGDLKIVLLDFGEASINVNDDKNNTKIFWRSAKTLSFGE
jgi:predicted unusual protein kinase regulating ubiquinone biosynthesis (AarF/ABC1/UbiB family)